MAPLDPTTTTSQPHEFDPLEGYTRRPSPTNTINSQQKSDRRMSDAGAPPPRVRPSGRRSSTGSRSHNGGRRGSKSAAEWATIEEDEIEREREERDGGDSAGRRRRGRVPLQPPKDPELFNTEEEWRTHHEAEEKTSAVHHLPLILVALPPLGAIVHGRAENWSDALILILVCFYLYQLIKVPWDIYYASHARVILSGSLNSAASPDEDPSITAKREYSVQQLRRAELLSLLSTLIVPFVGSCLLYYVRGVLSDPDRYINRFLISLFALATSVKPFLHFAKLVKHHSLYHQEQVWYPSTEVHFLRRRVESLEKELSTLTRGFATKDEVQNFADELNRPLAQLAKGVRLAGKKEDSLRYSTDEKFALLDARLQSTTSSLLAQSELLERLRYQQEQETTLAQIFRALRYVLGQRVGARGQGQVKWFEKGVAFWVFLPINAPRLAIEYVAGGNEDGLGHGGYVKEDGEKKHE